MPDPNPLDDPQLRAAFEHMGEKAAEYASAISMLLEARRILAEENHRVGPMLDAALPILENASFE